MSPHNGVLFSSLHGSPCFNNPWGFSLKDQIEIRPGEEGDYALIFTAWLKSYKEQSPFAKKISSNVFYDKHHKIIANLLYKKKAKVLIAHPVDEPDIIVGFLVFEGTTKEPIIHYIYTKEHFRGLGVASTLLDGLELGNGVFTHWNYICGRFWNSEKYKGLAFDPYLI